MSLTFLKMGADFVAEPRTDLFNLTVETNHISSVWKSAFVLHLHKGGDPATLNNYRPISNLPVLTKIPECLVSEQIQHPTKLLYISGFRAQISVLERLFNDLV